MKGIYQGAQEGSCWEKGDGKRGKELSEVRWFEL